MPPFDWFRSARAALLLTGAVVIVGCGGDSSGPDPVDLNSIEGQITALYPSGPTLRDAAMAKIAATRAALTQNNSAAARTNALSLVDLTLGSLREGKLTGGKTQATRASASKLVDALYQ